MPWMEVTTGQGAPLPDPHMPSTIPAPLITVTKVYLPNYEQMKKYSGLYLHLLLLSLLGSAPIHFK
jgi:hypothetical protein